MVGRYTHAHQFKRTRRELKFLRTRLGPRSSAISAARSTAMPARSPLHPAARSRHQGAHQDHRQRGPKVYALHAPEVECIGKGKARTPYEFGCKVSRRDAGHLTQGRPVRAPCQGAARQSLRRPHPRPDRRRPGEAHRRRGPPHPRRQGLSRPQPSEQVPGLDLAARSAASPPPSGAR